MPQYEYRKIDLNSVPRKSDEINLLDAAGQQGWELVQITPNLVAYMKRLIDEPEPEPPRRRSKEAGRSTEG
jgi:hypothetical protein